MNDNDIVKALMCCKDAECLNCPRWTDEWYSGQCNDFLQDVLDLINRQKEEIERLNHIRAELSKEIDIWKDIAKRETGYVGIARSEAIKEFAERLKAEATLQHGGVTVVYGSCIDNLAKEMTEVKK